MTSMTSHSIREPTMPSPPSQSRPPSPTPYTITYMCPICQDNSYNHSFRYMGSYSDIVYMYTCPEKAILYKDTHGILEHYTGVMEDLYRNDKQWIWVFDARQFSLKHYIQFDLVIGLAKLICNPMYSNRLISILVYSPTWHLERLLQFITPFLSQSVKEKIHTITNIPRHLRTSSIWEEGWQR